MYGNIGKKIKVLATIIFFVEAAITMLLGAIWIIAEEEFFSGLLMMTLGPVVAWLSTWFLYAFGDIADKTRETAENTALLVDIAEERSRIENFSRLRAEGLISDIDYKQAIFNIK